MSLPLALTLGEPAGIGPDITLAVWQRREELALPPFYLLADPDFLARRAQQLGLDVPHPRGRAGCRRESVCHRAAGRGARRARHRRAGTAGSIERPGGDRIDPPRGRRRFRRPRACGRDQSGRQGGAVPHRLRRAGPHRISRQARAGGDRTRRASGDDAVVAGARRRAGDDPPAGARGAAAPDRRADRRRPAASWRAICASASASRGRGSRSPDSIRMPARTARSARRTPRWSRPRSSGCAARASTRADRCRPTPCFTPRRGAATMRRSRCITIRR